MKTNHGATFNVVLEGKERWNRKGMELWTKESSSFKTEAVKNCPSGLQIEHYPLLVVGTHFSYSKSMSVNEKYYFI